VMLTCVTKKRRRAILGGRATLAMRGLCCLSLVLLFGLAGCNSVRLSSEDYGSEFAGRYDVTDRSSASFLPLQSVDLELTSGRSGILTLTTPSGMSRLLVRCDSYIGQWENTLRSPVAGEAFRGLSCLDNNGVRWHFVHAVPGTTTITPFFTRVSQHAVNTSSGYLLRRAGRGELTYDYALTPTSRTR
jgi:hypothetical protein